MGSLLFRDTGEFQGEGVPAFYFIVTLVETGIEENDMIFWNPPGICPLSRSPHLTGNKAN